MDPNIHVAVDADIVRIDGIELDDPEVADYVRSWPPEAPADAVTEALWVGVITMGRIEATHIQRRYTMMLEVLDRTYSRYFSAGAIRLSSGNRIFSPTSFSNSSYPSFLGESLAEIL